MTRFWMVRAGAGSVYAQAFADAGYIGIGWKRAGDFTNLDTADAMRARMESVYAADPPASRSKSFSQSNKFRNVIAPGDRVVTYDGANRQYLLGTVVGEYEYRKGLLPESPHVRAVKWEGRVPRSALRQSSLNTLGAILTLFEPGEDVLRDLVEAMETGRTSPPAGAVVTDDEDDLESLYAQFETEYLNTERGQAHLAAYKTCMETGRQNMANIVRRADAGEDVTDLILNGLLPHADTEFHRRAGQWIHIAPAILKDIRSWYEGSGLATPEEWPAKAALILEFVRRVSERPEELAAACVAFGKSPMSKGWQCGMLTPILNALRPDVFAIVNRKVVDTVSALTGLRLTPLLSAYPESNATVMQFVSDNNTIFAEGELEGCSPLMAFDMMAHWYVAVREDEDEDEDAPKKRSDRVVPNDRSALDRQTAASAASILERLCPDGAPRAVALDYLARSIQFIDAIAPAGWSVTLKERLVRLNVSSIVAIDIRPDGVGIVLHEPSLTPAARRTVATFADDFTFKFLADLQSYSVPYDHLNPTLSLLRDAHNVFLEQVAAKSRKAPYRSSHSPGVLRLLRELGHDVRDPAYSTVAPVFVDPVPPRGVGKAPRELHPLYSIEQAAKETLILSADLEKWVRMINRKGQAILYGPPGTGKTFVAEHLARILASGGDGSIELVQFHPSYAYEDFIQGIRPRSSLDGALSYEMMPGRFIDFCRGAAAATGPSVLIIDEINRANLASVFGELMYLLEYRDRSVPLAGGDTLRIPANVRLIGTMNTADRSVALVDHALRRRFGFIRLDPDFSILSRFHNKSGRDVDGLISVLEKLNERIADPHYSIGISYFMRETLREDLEAIWEGEVEPYVEELFFDRRAELDPFRWSAIRDRVIV